MHHYNNTATAITSPTNTKYCYNYDNDNDNDNVNKRQPAVAPTAVGLSHQPNEPSSP